MVAVCSRGSGQYPSRMHICLHSLPRLSAKSEPVLCFSSIRLSRPTPCHPGWIYLYARPPLVRALSLTLSLSHRSPGHTIPFHCLTVFDSNSPFAEKQGVDQDLAPPVASSRAASISVPEQNGPPKNGRKTHPKPRCCCLGLGDRPMDSALIGMQHGRSQCRRQAGLDLDPAGDRSPQSRFPPGTPAGG